MNSCIPVVHRWCTGVKTGMAMRAATKYYIDTMAHLAHRRGRANFSGCSFFLFFFHENALLVQSG